LACKALPKGELYIKIPHYKYKKKCENAIKHQKERKRKKKNDFFK